MCKTLPCLMCLFTLAAGLSNANLARSADYNEFLDYSLTNSAGDVLLPGRLFVPDDTTTPRPLILFLHGAGAIGTNNIDQVNRSINNLLAEAKRRDAFLYAPQTSSGWSDRLALDRTLTVLDRALSEFPIETGRQYATGLSMGGGGTWNVLNRAPGRFAAAVPIAAIWPNFRLDQSELHLESIWAFHARNDGVVSKDSTRYVVNSILSNAGETPIVFPSNNDPDLFEFVSESPDLRYTEPALGGHGIWGTVYSTPEMYEWLFAHPVPEPHVGSVIFWSALSLARFLSHTGRTRRHRVLEARGRRDSA